MMTISGFCATFRVTAASAALGLMFSMTSVASAQEVSAEHLSQARSAIAAIGATNQFDDILPYASDALKQELIQKDPNLEDLITTTVDNEVLALAARRTDLENEAARVYAKVFSQDELKAIADFYATDAGKKLLMDGPLATRQLIEAANIWQAGIGRDLAQNVANKIKAAAPAEAEAPKEDAPKEEAPKDAPKEEAPMQ